MERTSTVYTWGIDTRLRLLNDLVGRVDATLPVEDLLAHPGMVTVRTLAAALLIDFNNLRYRGGTWGGIAP